MIGLGLLLGLLAAGAAPGTAETGWTRLWNGRDLDGWQQVGPGRFVVENGILKTEGGPGLLWYTKGKIADALLRVVYKNMSARANSGVFIRIPNAPPDPRFARQRGYEVQIDDSGDDHHVTGVLDSLTRAQSRPGNPGEWNTMEITLDGPRTIVSVNGDLVTDYTEGQPVAPRTKDDEPHRGPRPRSGYVGLQNHSPEDVVYFREISVRPLAK